MSKFREVYKSNREAKFKKIREDNGISLGKLAIYLGISRTKVWEIENQIYRLTTDYLELYADFFNTTTDYLLGRQEKKLKENNFSDIEINSILKSDDVLRDIKIKAFKILALLTKEANIEQIIYLTGYLLNQERESNKE